MASGGAPAAGEVVQQSYFARLCETARSSQNLVDEELELDSSNGVHTANGAATAPGNLGLVVYFKLTQSSRDRANLLALQFHISNAAGQKQHPDMCMELEADTNRWIPVNRGALQSREKSAGNRVCTRDFADIVATRWSNAYAHFAVYLRPSYSITWKVLCATNAGKKCGVSLSIVHLKDVAQFHEQYIECLGLANECDGAFEVFKHNNTEECENYLTQLRADLLKEKAVNAARSELNTASIASLRQQVTDLEEKFRLARIREEAVQRANAEKRRDEQLDARIQAMRDEAKQRTRTECEDLRRKLADEYKQKQSAKEAEAVTAHEQELERLRKEHAEKTDAITAQIASQKRVLKDLQRNMERMEALHLEKVEAMRARVAQETESEMADSEEALMAAVQAYEQGRLVEKEVMSEEEAAVVKQTRIFQFLLNMLNNVDDAIEAQ